MRLLSAQVKLDPSDEGDRDALVLMQCGRPFLVTPALVEASSVRVKRDGTAVVTVKPAGGDQ